MLQEISYLTESVTMPDLNFQFIDRWISAVAEGHNRIVGALTYIFCNDDRILDVNRRFLQHDYYTDIITFDYSRGKLLRGDMYISLETVASNAEGVGESYERELLRVIIHGVLHLCGINDKGPGEREIMESHEEAALSLFQSLKSQDYEARI